MIHVRKGFKVGLLVGAVAGLVAGIVTSPRTAAALDEKGYPGAYCVQHSNSGGNLKRSWTGQVYNNSTSGTRALCPLINNTFQGFQPESAIGVYDGHNVKSVDCWLRSAFGIEVMESLYDSSGGAFVGGTVLHFANQGALGGGLRENYFDCLLPEKRGSAFSRIYYYFGYEAD